MYRADNAMELQNQSIHYCESSYGEFASKFSKDVLKGLTAEKKHLPCKYIYDKRGSRLFQKIMDLPEYYPTDCEKEILTQNGNEISQYFSAEPLSIIELGAGDGAKTEILLRAMLSRKMDLRYIPIDISESAVEGLVHRLTQTYYDLYTAGLVSEYFHGLKHLSAIEKRKKLVFFLGSNIGNMTYEESMNFLSSLRDSVNKDDHVFIGFDLKKDFSILNKAYNDSKGITAEFNKNILVRINKELMGNFNVDNFRFHSFFEPGESAVVSYLVSKKNQGVLIKDLNLSFELDKCEAIHTESSYKYTEEMIYTMAAESGFSVVKNFKDKKNYFMDSLWMVI